MSYVQNDLSQPVDLSYNHINVQVFQLLEDLDVAGQTTSPRGLTTVEANLATLDIDPIYSVMDFSPRKFNWRYFAGELAWYIKAENNVDFINNFSSFWKNITDKEGKINSNYGDLLFNSHPSTRMGKEKNQLEWVYESLKKDKHSRQAVAFFNSPHFQAEGNKDFVCTMYINFWIRKDHLDMKVQMRSNDIFFGLTYDAPWFSTIHQSMWLNLKEIYPELKLGMYYHSADNIHYYERHFEIVDKILDSPLDSSIKLKLKHPLFAFRDREDGSSSIYMTNHATNYLNMVQDVVDSGNVPIEKNYWKSLLGYLYNITEDTEINS